MKTLPITATKEEIGYLVFEWIELLAQEKYAEGLDLLCHAFVCCFELKYIDIPSAAKVASWAFENTGLKNIKLPYGIEDISNAFKGCAYLECVYVPGTVKDIRGTFSDCENLREVTIENGVTSLGDYAFFNCTSLKELTIPESVMEFGTKSVGIMEIKEYTSPKKLGYRIKGYQTVPGFKIKGKAGSEAERYAKNNGIEFVQI